MKRKSQEGNRPGAGAKRKTELVFDPLKRTEFLSGFHKRKLHRKKVAQGQLERKLKEETRRIRTEAKENKKKLYHSYKPIPELTAEDREEQQEQEYDTENVTVKVVELSTKELAKQNNWIGENHGMVRGDQEDEDESDGDEGEQQSSEEEDDDDAVDTIPGMELDAASRKKKPNLKLDGENDEEPEEPPAKKPQQQRGPVLNLEGIRSKKEMKHKLKRHALKSLKNSKAYQQTQRAQQQKQLKKSRRVRHVREKKLKKQGKLPSGEGGRGGGKGGKRRGGRE
uniref:Nucleolar protein 12 n=1 Tax=Culex pipiens TaxID=7175 RepID=A0A8D8BE30_CULPI